MRPLRVLRARIASLFRRNADDRDLADEIESNLRLDTDDGVRRGLSADEARREALLRLGGVDVAREEVLRRRGLPAIETIVRDARHAVRLMRRNPGFTLVVVLTLALGIGANSAMFSVVDGVLLRPLPYPDADRLVQVWHVPPPKSFPGLTQFSLSPGNYLDWRAQNHVFEHFAAYGYGSAAFHAADRPESITLGKVASDLFDTLGVRPFVGRGFLPEEDAAGRGAVVILGHDFWRSRCGADPGIVGRELTLDGRAFTVVGVMPAGFRFPRWADVYVPLAWDAQERAVRGNHNYHAVARLKPGVSLEQAQAEMSAIAQRLTAAYPEDNAGWGAVIVPLHREITGDVRPALLVLFGAVGFVLLIACANIANLLLSRTLDRRKEIALRAALGASRVRVLHQMLCETVLLALLGGALGLLVAHEGLSWIVAHLADRLPRAAEIHLDGRVLAFTLLVSALTGLLAGIAPAWRLTRTDINTALKQGLGRTDTDSGGQRTRSVLLVGQVALSLVLLVGAGLMIRTLALLRRVDPGFDPRGVLTMSVPLVETRYADGEHQGAFYTRALDQIRALPGIDSAGGVTNLPVSEGGSMQPIAIEGRPAQAMAEQPEVAVREITPGYLRAMRIPVIRGRDIDEADTAARAPVVLVSESMARQFWPGEDPLGKRLVLSFRPGIVREVVGVVGEVRQSTLASTDPDPTLYAPHAQCPGPWLTLAVRSASGRPPEAAPIVAALARIDPEQPAVDVAAMDDILDGSLSQERLSMSLLATFAALALLLATLGIYSLLSYAVRRRAQEIGIRMALGARRADVVRMVLGQGLRLTVAGLVFGLAASLLLTRLLTGFLYGVRPTDPVTFAGVVVLLGAVAIAASLLPARRAARVDPLVALRSE